MSDILLSSQRQLTLALKQLQSAGNAATTGLQQQASQAMVQHLSGNQLLLQTQKGELQLPGRTIRGQLSAGQIYTLTLDNKDTGKLIFSTPPGLLQSGRSDVNSTTISQLIPKALAEVILAQSLSESLAPVTDKLKQSVNVEHNTVALSAKVIAAQGTRLTLQLANTQIDVQLPRPPLELSKGQIVQLRYQNTGEWALTMEPKAPASQNTVKVTMPANQVSPLTVLIAKDKTIPLSQSSVENLLQKAPPSLQPLLPLLNQLRTMPDAGALNVTHSGKVNLLLTMTNGTEKASISLSDTQRQSLQQLLPTLAGQKPTPNSQVITSQPAISGQNLSVAQQNADLVSPQLLKPSADSTTNQSLQLLLRRTLAIQESPALNMSKVEQALKDSVINQPDTAKVVQQLTQQLNQSLPKGTEQDAVQLRALLSQPAMALTPLSLTTSTSQQGFIGGLVTLLQLSLAARQARNQPAQGERLAERISGMLETVSGGNRVSPRGLADFAQAEQRHQLIRNLNLLLASHTGHKASSAESQLQGQDSFYYSLPVGQDSNRKDIELLIRREPPPDKKNQQQHGGDKQWNLTMKMDIGELGGLLAKARLYDTQLELDFYAANDKLKDKVIAFLPHLKKRFEALGIDINHSQCQLGKIPQHLQQRPYQVFETQA
ncbi:flagellar hook-length control protein FliK [Lacimicrobium alkaliphilum]|uniref:Flagellar hook-length control protein-like C-terminal domain-containing protein n=1 Tax=Lacimicrobium alkaliphilum TaxID=1526571 RepID=A0ABQ1RN72_9ALTE|nr:flagellar hook-length control protein FliK [Lacimicrobium alkaliphilum]GGD72644.1 hypothetical protein GCM10011357_29590 [Lacimicrobium alkaliphilum]